MTNSKIDIARQKAYEKAMIELYSRGQRKFYVTNERPNIDVGQVLDLTAYKSKIPFKAKVASLGFKSAGKVWEYTLEVVGLKAKDTNGISKQRNIGTEIAKNNLIEIEVKEGSDYASIIVTEDGRIRHLTGWNEKIKATAIEAVKKHFKGKCGRLLYHAEKGQVALFEASGFTVYREDSYVIGAVFMEYVYG